MLASLAITAIAKDAHAEPLFSMLSDELRAAVNAPRTWSLRPEVLRHPNIPKPLHGVAPRIILGKEWWDQEREKAYQSTENHCVACGVHRYQAEEHKWLEAHELYDIDYRKGRMIYVEAIPLCHYCHCFIHSGRLEALRDRGEISNDKYNLVMRHGRRVLKAAGIKKRKAYKGQCAAWETWRLLLFGKEYTPVHKTYEDWLRFYGGLEVEE